MTEQYKACCSSTVSVKDSSGSSLVSYVLLWRQLWKAVPRLKYPISFSQNQPSLLSPSVPVALKYIDTVTATQDCWWIFTILLWFSSSRMFNLQAEEKDTSLRQNVCFHFCPQSCGKSVLVIINFVKRHNEIIVNHFWSRISSFSLPICLLFLLRGLGKQGKSHWIKELTVSFMFSCLDGRILW